MPLYTLKCLTLIWKPAIQFYSYLWSYSTAKVSDWFLGSSVLFPIDLQCLALKPSFQSLQLNVSISWYTLPSPWVFPHQSVQEQSHYWCSLDISRLKGSVALFLEYFHSSPGPKHQLQLFAYHNVQVSSWLKLLHSPTHRSTPISHKVLPNAALYLPITRSHIDEGRCIYCDGCSWGEKK